jgi:hypothetical protein
MDARGEAASLLQWSHSRAILVCWGLTMAFYRFDVQYGVPYDPAPDGFYWGTQIWYAEADTDAEYAHAREGAVKITTLWLPRGVLAWNLLVRFWPSEAVVENVVAPQYSHPVLSGLWGAMETTAYVSLRSDGKQVSYKRIRGPVRLEDYTADGLLTPFAHDYYQSVADMVADYGCFRNAQGVLIDDAIVSPRIHNWQLRHGTTRKWRRRIV